MTKKADKNYFTKKVYGLTIVKSENSNFNADFSHSPRRLPDSEGTIYATDKSLKYPIRRYLKEILNKNIFVWQRSKDNGQPMSLPEVYADIVSINKFDAENVFENLTSHVDVRLFGVTFTEIGKNISIIGPAQITYGVNRFKNNTSYSNQIKSPYRNSSEKKKNDMQTTIGSESKALESHYVFDFVVNPFGLTYFNEDGKSRMILKEDDYKNFQIAMNRGVTDLNSCSKIGSEIEFVIYITLIDEGKGDGKRPTYVLPNLKKLVTIYYDEKDMDKPVIDLIKLEKFLKTKDSIIEKIELFYEKEFVELKGMNTENFNENIISSYSLTDHKSI